MGDSHKSQNGMDVTETLQGGSGKCPFVKGPLKIKLCKGLDVLGFRPTAHQVSMLCRYLEHLHKWNKVYNLTAIRDMDDMLVQHMFDCLAIVKPLQTWFQPCVSENAPCPASSSTRPRTSFQVLDVGSGAGLPAVVIAIMFPEWQVTAVDAVAKKMAFVQQVSSSLGLVNLTACHSRVEELKERQYNLIVSRAFSSLCDFVGLTRNVLADEGVWCAMKGKEPLEEIEELQHGDCAGEVKVFHVEQLQVPSMEASRCLVWMKKV